MANDIAPFTTTTNNVSLAINQAAVKFGVVPARVGFDIMKVTTTIKNMKTKQSEDVEIFTNKDLINPSLLLSQKYELIMRQKENNASSFPDILFANNKSHTIVYLIIKRNQDLQLSEFTKKVFLSHLESILITHKCFIRVDEEESLSKAVDKLYDNYKIGEIIAEDIKITALNFPDAIKPIPDSLELTYRKYKQNNDDDNKDKKKVQLASVKEGTLVIEYKKITIGIPGRTYESRMINVNAIKPNHIPNFSIDPKTIKKEETSTKILYIAKETGFVFFEKKFLRIDNKTEMSTANIRNKDKLVTSLDDGVSINIKSKDKLSDAVGGNINIKSDKVNINGNVGPSANVEGNMVKIGGQTHSKSKIKGQKVLISKHKGLVEGVDVKIEILEGGIVKAKNAYIKIARGGKIEGENIIIDNLESNVEIIASNSIKIKSLTGESNTFTLKPVANSFMEKEDISIEDLLDKKDIIEDAIAQQNKELIKKLSLIEFNEKSLDIQRGDKIDKLSYNIRSSRTMDAKMKNYVKLYDEKDAIVSDIDKKQKELKEIDKKIDEIYSNTENAFLEMNSPWTDGNSIHIYSKNEIYKFYPIKDTMKSPISFDILEQENLI